jgi:hypothetical protein
MGSDSDTEHKMDRELAVEAEDSPCVEGEIQLRADELHRAVSDMPENRWARRFIFGGIVVFFGYTSYSLSAAGDTRRAILFVAPIGFLIALLLLFKQLQRRTLKKNSPEGRQLRFRFDAEGYAVETPNASSKLKYGALVRFVESETALLLYTQSNFAQVLPKRALSATELDQVRAWLKAGVPPRKTSAVPKRVYVVWALLILAFFGIWQLLSSGR